MSRILRVYKDLLKKYPIAVQSVQAGILMGACDQVAQNFVERRKYEDLNFVRSAQFASIGLFVAGPALKTWYAFLEKRMGSKTPSTAFKKVLIDQTCFAPLFLAVLLSLIGVTHGNDLEGIKRKLKNDYPDILINNYKLWPMVQLVNFYFVRLEYQSLVVQVVALFWNTYFSYRANRDVQPDNKNKDS